jgi:hypothetical protein
MNVLFDSMSSQVQIQDTQKTRLNTLLGAMESFGYVGGPKMSVSFSDYQQEISSQLSGVDVLVIFTRHPAQPSPIPAGTDFSFTANDLSNIPSWVDGGGGLLLISNHGPGGGNPTDWTIYDAPLAKAFGVTIVPAMFSNANETGNPLDIVPAVPATSPFAPVTSFVSSILAHNSCGVQAGTGSTVIAPIPAGCKDLGSHHYNPADYDYAVGVPWGKGAVIVAGNSGISGDLGNNDPAPGMIASGNDLRFLLNSIAYLGLL